MNSDTIQFLNRFKNAQEGASPYFLCKFSKKLLIFLKILKSEGVIAYFQVVFLKGSAYYKVFTIPTKKFSIRLVLRSNLKSPSASFLRKDVWKMPSRLGVLLFNTSRGVSSNRIAKVSHLGGEFLFYIN